jgi:hypothetical protein
MISTTRAARTSPSAAPDTMTQDSEDKMKARIIETTIDIAAPVEHVWKTLIDFTSFPEWSRFILAIEGEAQPGTRLSVRLDDGGGAMRMRPEVVACEERVELRWRGVVGAGFLFSGEHRFRLDALPGGTRLTHGEVFSGVLVPLFWKTLNTRTRQAFHEFNAALRARAEAVVR